MIIYTYAGILGLLYIVMTFTVIRQRRKNQILYGYGKNNEIAGVVSAHGNFAAYVPFAVILLFLIETKLNSSQLIHIIGSIIVIGRVSHFISLGFLEKKGILRFRVLGMLCTIFPIIFMSIRLIF